MPMILVLLVTVPLLAAAPRPVTEVLTAVTGLVTAGLALALVPAVSDHTVTAGHYLRAAAVSVVFLAGHPRSCTPRPGCSRSATTRLARLATRLQSGRLDSYMALHADRRDRRPGRRHRHHLKPLEGTVMPPPVRSVSARANPRPAPTRPSTPPRRRTPPSATPATTAAPRPASRPGHRTPASTRAPRTRSRATGPAGPSRSPWTPRSRRTRSPPRTTRTPPAAPATPTRRPRTPCTRGRRRRRRVHGVRGRRVGVAGAAGGVRVVR